MSQPLERTTLNLVDQYEQRKLTGCRACDADHATASPGHCCWCPRHFKLMPCHSESDLELLTRKRRPPPSLALAPAHRRSSNDRANPKQSAMSLDCTVPSLASADERYCFKVADKNSDGSLDFDEIQSLMKDRFLDARKDEVRNMVNEVFDAADKNRDGKLDFGEIIDYTHATTPSTREMRGKMLAALMAPLHTPAITKTYSKQNSVGMRRASSVGTAGGLISGSKRVNVKPNVSNWKQTRTNRLQRMRTSMLIDEP